jgi:cystathionine beta-lyase/cystathionine gamma-synthase
MSQTPKKPYTLSPTTAMISEGFDPKLSVGSARPAVFRSSTYVFSSPEAAEEAFAVALGKKEPTGPNELIYSRLSHPNAEILETHLCAMEPEAKGAAVFNSGMAAIASILLTFCKPGRSFVYTTPIYGGTHHLISEMLMPMGFKAQPVMAGDTQAMVETIQNTPDLDLVFVETPSNPTLTLTDIQAVHQAIDQHPNNPLFIVDNTFMGPTFQHPLEWGADLIMYSATKFLGGFSDMLGGAVLGKDPVLVDQLRGTRAITGNILQPDECWILDSRLPLVEFRMKQESQHAQQLVQALRNHPRVSNIHYPTEFQGSQKEIYEKQCSGPGSIFSLVLEGGKKSVFSVLRRLALVKNAVSLGGMESLACHPTTTTHSEMTPDQLQAYGITDGLIRFSIGLENPRDLLHDIEQALDFE